MAQMTGARYELGYRGLRAQDGLGLTLGHRQRRVVVEAVLVEWGMPGQ